MDSNAFSAPADNSEATARRRKLVQVETLIAEMKLSMRNLDLDIKAEEQRTRISDPHHVAYSTLAMAANARRDNLKRTVAKLEEQLVRMRQVFEMQAANDPGGADLTPRTDHAA